MDLNKSFPMASQKFEELERYSHTMRMQIRANLDAGAQRGHIVKQLCNGIQLCINIQLCLKKSSCVLILVVY